jgi:hypothetical protein
MYPGCQDTCVCIEKTLSFGSIDLQRVSVSPLCLSLFLCLSLYLSHSLSLCLSLSFSVSLSIFLTLSLALSLSTLLFVPSSPDLSLIEWRLLVIVSVLEAIWSL